MTKRQYKFFQRKKNIRLVKGVIRQLHMKYNSPGAIWISEEDRFQIKLRIESDGNYYCPYADIRPPDTLS